MALGVEPDVDSKDQMEPDVDSKDQIILKPTILKLLEHIKNWSKYRMLISTTRCTGCFFTAPPLKMSKCQIT